MPAAMIPTSEAQFRAATEGGLPEPEEVTPGTWSIGMPMPGAFLGYTLTAVQLTDGGGTVVVDPGYALEGSLERLASFLTSVGSDVQQVSDVVLTHAHPDHIGLAPILRQRSGARLHMHAQEQQSIAADAATRDETFALLAGWGVSPDHAARLLAELPPPKDDLTIGVIADVMVVDGEILDLPGKRWRALWTPGHTPGHVCIVDEAAPLLFSGDHILPTVHPGIGLGRQNEWNPVAAYLTSLEKLEPYDDREVVPGHGYRFRGLKARREASRSHVLRRAREVAVVAEARPEATAYEIASQLTWTGGWPQIESSLMLMTALMQTEQYRRLALTSPDLLI